MSHRNLTTCLAWSAEGEPKNGMSPEAREALIEHRRLMREQRAFAHDNRARIDAEWDALEAPPLTIAGHIASITPARWAELNAEWEA